MADIYRLFEGRYDRQLNRMKSHFDQQDKKLDELIEKTREINQRFAGLEHGARQPCLAMEADVTPETKTRKRTGDAAIDQVMNEDSSSARKVDIGPTSSTSFGMIIESPALLCMDDALVGKGAGAPRSCLSPVEMHMLLTAGGLLPVDTVPTAMRTIVFQSPPSWALGEETKERTSQTGSNQLPPPFWRRIIQTKQNKTPVFDPGGSTDRLRACPFLGGRRALLWGEVFV